MHAHTQPTINGFGRNVHLWHFPWPKRPGRNVLGRNVRGRNVRAPSQLILSTLSSKEGIEFIPGSVFIGSNKVKNVVWIVAAMCECVLPWYHGL